MDEEASERESTAFPKCWPYIQMVEEETTQENSKTDKESTQVRGIKRGHL